MTQQQSRRGVLRAMDTAVAIASMMGLMAPAEARGSHGLHHASRAHHGRGGGSLASDRSHANDTYVNAATQDEDKVLDTKVKSICRGC
jgi:hypothetical protein